ncbi:MAG: hypothetical protein Q7R83_01370, partial [bacterium]|nr:hypothetical protein [bacterium]
SAALFTCLGVLGMLFADRDYIRRLNAVRVCRAPELLPASREEATEDIVGLKAIEARVSNCLTALAASYAELVGKRSRTQGALAARREKQDRLEVLEDELRDKKRTRKDSPFRDEFNAALEDLEKRKVAIDVELSHLEGLKKAAAAKIARQRRQLYALRRRIDEYRLLQAYQRETTGVGSIDPELVTSAHDQCASVEEFGERVNAMLDAADTSTRGVDGSLERELATIEKLLTEVANLLPEEPVR